MKGSLKFELIIYANFITDRVWPMCEVDVRMPEVSWFQLMAYGIRRIAINNDVDSDFLRCQGTQPLENVYIYSSMPRLVATNRIIAVEVANEDNVKAYIQKHGHYAKDHMTTLFSFEERCRSSLNEWRQNKTTYLMRIKYALRGVAEKRGYIKSMRIDFDTIFLQRTEWKDTVFTSVLFQDG